MGETSGRRGTRRLLALISLVAVTGLGLAACSSGTPNSSSSSTSSSSNSTSSSSPNGTGGSSTTAGGSSTSARLAALEANVQSAKSGTFKLTYAETSSAQNGTLTFEQLPPKYLFSVGGAHASDIIDTGTATYACSGESGHEYCYAFGSSSSTTDPFASLLDIITGASVTTALHNLQTGLAARLQGVQASFSSQTFAGQPSQCVAGTYRGNSFKYCVTNSGVLAYAGGSGTKTYGSLSLTSYSTGASASDFALPTGATVVSLPSTSTSAP